MRVRLTEDHGKFVAKRTYDLPSAEAKSLIRSRKGALVPKSARVEITPTPAPDPASEPDPDVKPKARSKRTAKAVEN